MPNIKVKGTVFEGLPVDLSVEGVEIKYDMLEELFQNKAPVAKKEGAFLISPSSPLLKFREEEDRTDDLLVSRS